jgi:hypothetical protein
MRRPGLPVDSSRPYAPQIGRVITQLEEHLLVAGISPAKTTAYLTVTPLPDDAVESAVQQARAAGFTAIQLVDDRTPRRRGTTPACALPLAVAAAVHDVAPSELWAGRAPRVWHQPDPAPRRLLPCEGVTDRDGRVWRQDQDTDEEGSYLTGGWSDCGTCGAWWLGRSLGVRTWTELLTARGPMTERLVPLDSRPSPRA